MTILVTGATGTVGRGVVELLIQRGHRVRALTRDPSRAAMPEGVEVFGGDLTAPASLEPALDGVTAVQLVSMAGDRYAPLSTAPDVLDRCIRAGVGRVTVLTGTGEELAVARAVADSGLEWVHIRPPADYMANMKHWAAAIRGGDVVHAAFSSTPHHLVHERDVAAVIVAGLLDTRLSGRTLGPTGPEALAPSEAARRIGQALGREVRIRDKSPQQAREELLAAGFQDGFIDFYIEYGMHPPAVSNSDLAVVKEVTGRPARTFDEWIVEHAKLFRAHA